jgi:hypothetical protein
VGIIAHISPLYYSLADNKDEFIVEFAILVSDGSHIHGNSQLPMGLKAFGKMRQLGKKRNSREFSQDSTIETQVG